MKIDYRISIIRILSMLAIVLCHIFQAIEMNIAFWLNVGVQIFLFMSGFLYGRKEIKNVFLWIKKQYKKILIPYYIYLFIIITTFFIFKREYLTTTNVLSILLCLELLKGFPFGLNHFWFIPVILICYLITPILQRIIKTDTKYRAICIICIIVIVELMTYQSLIDPRINNIVCYVVGYLISNVKFKNNKKEKSISIIIIMLALIANVIKIITIFKGINATKMFLLDIIIKNSHILLGCAIFIVLYEVLKFVTKVLNLVMLKCIDIVDKYCFYIYITHHIFILGPFSIMNLTQCLLLNIIIIIGCIITSSYILEKLTKLVKKGLEEHEKNYASLWHETRSNKNVPIS